MSVDGIVGEDKKYVLQCELSTSVEFGGIFPRLVKYGEQKSVLFDCFSASSILSVCVFFYVLQSST